MIHMFCDVGKARQPREKLPADFSVNVLQNRNKWPQFRIIKFYLINGMNLESLNSI